MKNNEYIFPQEPLIEESFKAIKDSLRFEKFDSFQLFLLESLPQNSSSSRSRYAGVIIKRFFSDHSLNQLTTKVWQNYRDDDLLLSIMKYQFLSIEKLIGLFVEEKLFKMNPGTKLNRNFFLGYIQEIFKENNEKATDRLLYCLIKLGFLTRFKYDYFVTQQSCYKDALIILIHYIFANKPSTIDITFIIKNPFWKYLGLKSNIELKKILKEAFSKGIINKYVTADQLEQITTKYSLDELLSRKIRI